MQSAEDEVTIERSHAIAQRKWGVYKLYNSIRMFHTPTVANKDLQGEELMKHAILDGGPIAAHIDVSDKLFGLKAGEVYKGGTNTGGHAIMIYGWGEHTDGTPVWLCKNSWGKDWPKENNGEGNSDKPSGLFMVERGKNVGQIESEPTSWIYVHPGLLFVEGSPGHFREAINYQKTKDFLGMTRETDIFSYGEYKISLYGGLDTEEKLPWCTLPNMGLMEPAAGTIVPPHQTYQPARPHGRSAKKRHHKRV